LVAIESHEQIVSAEGSSQGASDAESERTKLVGRAGIVGAGTLASRLLGLARDMVLAAVFSRQ